MLSCRDAARLISARLDAPIGLQAGLSLNFHVLMCGPCRRYARTLRRLGEVARDLVEDESAKSLSADERVRLEAAIDGEAARRPLVNDDET
ncbi:MAG: hypothetical protein IV100_20530 [Myxococcales bacterium]|nr:hypothetical protein [Myxococcales bacterium]